MSASFGFAWNSLVRLSPMSGRPLQGSRGSSVSSSRKSDGVPSKSSMVGGSSSSARRRSSGSMGAGRGSRESTGGRSLQEISIPEGMDEEDESDGLDRKAKQQVLDSEFASMIEESDPDKFDRARLVEVLTAPYIEDAGGDIVALDPHALKKLFTTTISLLQEMGVDGERKRIAMAGATGAIEEDYRQGLAAHATRHNKVQDSLEGVEHRFRETAHKAVRIGDRLSRMEAQRARAAEAMDLLEYFKVFEGLPDGFSEDQDTVVRYMKLLPPVFSDEDRRAEAARVLSKLKSITHELETKELDAATRNLQAYSDFLEQELLDLFERAAGRSPPEVELMRECSDILFALNEGDHLQSRFVFYVVTQELQRGNDGQSAASAGSLSGLFRRVVSVCQNQFVVIGQVFPPSLVAKVTRLLLQRILNDPVYGVQARVEQVLSPQAPMEPLPLADYLNCLCTVEQQTAALFDMLKEHDFVRGGGVVDDANDNKQATMAAVVPASSAAADGSGGVSRGEFNSVAGGDSGEGGGDEGDEGDGSKQLLALRKYLDDQAKHMFFDHRVGYPAKERRHLLETLLLTSESVWEGMLQYRMVGKSVLVTLEAFPTIREEKVLSYLQLLSGPLRPSVWGAVFSCSAETVRRCRTIVIEEEEREQKVCEFFQVVCRYLADHLLTPALRCAKVLLPKPASNVASAALREMKGRDQLPPQEFYEAVKAVSKALTGLEDHYRDVVAPGMEDTPTLRTIAHETQKSLLHRVDAWTVKALQDAVRLLVLHAEKQIAFRSNKNDYCPKDDTAAIEATTTVKAVCSVLEEQHRVFVECLQEVDHRVDLRMLWESVGLKVHRLFVEHIKRTKVNVIGAFILANDVNRLQEVMRSFGCEEVTLAAEQLREIVNLFVVPPENLMSLMEQGMLKEMGKEELVCFVRMRADYHTGVGSRSQWARELFPHEGDGVSFGAFGGGG